MTEIAGIISLFIQVITFAIFFRVILTWFMVNSTSPFLISAYRVLVQITDPILAPLRKVVPRIGMFDITPIVAIILLQVVGEVIIAMVT
ncbi:MAG: YggT family protein [Dehalococcoidia bacterium]